MNARAPIPPTLLCVANFPANTGYAWDYIEGTFARLADALVIDGIRTLVAYPRIDERPRTLVGTAAAAVQLDAAMESTAEARALAAFCKRENVQAVYFVDRPVVHPGYAVLHRAGVRRIVVHDHTSGERVAASGLKRAAKWAAARAGGFAADVVVGVSDFVLRRQAAVAQVPRDRLVRVYNDVPVPVLRKADRERARAELGLTDRRPTVMCLARATPEKGLEPLFRAFDRLCAAGSEAQLVHIGDGPQLGGLRELRASLEFGARINLMGHRERASELLAAADLCVVPSVWQEAFGLSVAEPMARGLPVIASAAGAIPEVIEHGTSGWLVPPGDEIALAEAMGKLLANPKLARELGRNARARIRSHFNPQRTLAGLLAVVQPAFVGQQRWSA